MPATLDVRLQVRDKEEDIEDTGDRTDGGRHLSSSSMVEQHALDASDLFPKTESARSAPLQCPTATTSAQDVVGDKLGVLGEDRDGRVVREGHNTVPTGSEKPVHRGGR